MKKILGFLILFLTIFFNSVYSQTFINEDINVNTTWTTSGSPYIIQDDIIVAQWAILTINPGVYVKFESNTRLTVEGALNAQGNSSNQIIFTPLEASPSPGYWDGIYFTDTSDDNNCILSYCTIEYGNYGININNASPTIEYSTIQNSSGHNIYLSESDANIQNNIIQNSSYNNGISMNNSSSPIIENNQILSNYDGIYIDGQSDPTIDNNTINDHRYGIYSSGSTPLIQNNTITNSYYDGIYIRASTLVYSRTISGNTITNNVTGIYLYGTGSGSNIPTIEYNTITSNSNYGIEIKSSYSNPIINNNNLYDNVSYDVCLGNSNNIDAKYNWWGTVTTAQMNYVENPSNINKIYDIFDNSNYGMIDYGNWQLSPGGSYSTIDWTIVTNNFLYNQTWSSSDGPYIFVEDLEIPIGLELYITEGTELRFFSNIRLTVNGKLKAIGITSNPVTFKTVIPSPSPGYWDGIYFTDTSDDNNCILSYCTIEYGNYGININNASPTIEYSTIQNSSGHNIYLSESDANIQNNIIQNSSYNNGISMNNSSSPIIENNQILSNYDGIYIDGQSDPTIDNNTINDHRYGIYSSGSTPLIQNNTITNSYYDGIYIRASTLVYSRTISGNTITNNVTGIYLYGTGSGSNIPTIEYNTITSNSNYGIEIKSSYSNPIINNNNLYDNVSYDVCLGNSNNIDAKYNWWGTVTTAQMNSLPYPSDITKIYDYFDYSSYGIVQYEEWLPDSIIAIDDSLVVKPINYNLFQNYPNPFNPLTKIKYSILKDSRVELTVYNIKGKLVKKLVDENKQSGNYYVTWDGTNEKGICVGSGVYFYQIKAGNNSIIKNMLFLK